MDMADMKSIPIRVISKNIRYATTTPGKGELSWSARKDLLVNELRFNSLHNHSAFICCQEALHEQLKDILSGLQQFDKWSYVGWGRDDGHEAGEYSPIFYRPSVWKVTESNPIWLSKTPHDKGSRYPGAGTVRILSVSIPCQSVTPLHERAKFKHIETGITTIVYCTHLDNVSSAARKHAAQLICELASKDSSFPLLLAGDFNSETNQEAYRFISQSGLFKDVNDLDGNIKYGNLITFTGFEKGGEPPKRIDYVFYHNPSPSLSSPTFQVLDYAVLSNRFDDGIYNSDHRAVVADLVLSST